MTLLPWRLVASVVAGLAAGGVAARMFGYECTKQELKICYEGHFSVPRMMVFGLLGASLAGYWTFKRLTRG